GPVVQRAPELLEQDGGVEEAELVAPENADPAERRELLERRRRVRLEEGPRLAAKVVLLGGEGEVHRSAAPWEAEHALGDDVPEDLARPGLDRVAARAQLLVLPVAVCISAAVRELRVRAEDLERQLRQPLVVLRPHELRGRALRAWDPRLLERGQRTVV